MKHLVNVASALVLSCLGVAGCAASGSADDETVNDVSQADIGEDPGQALPSQVQAAPAEKLGTFNKKAPVQQETLGQFSKKAPPVQGETLGQFSKKAPPVQGETLGQFSKKAPPVQGETLGEFNKKVPSAGQFNKKALPIQQSSQLAPVQEPLLPQQEQQLPPQEQQLPPQEQGLGQPGSQPAIPPGA